MTLRPTTKKGITVHCDNIALVQRINLHFKRIVVPPKNVTAADYDVEKGITTTIDMLEQHNVIISIKHVKGHQDRKKAINKLSKAARMNIEADKDATLAMQLHSYSAAYSPIPTTQAMLYKQGKPVTSKESDTLRRAYLSQDLREHMINREKWQDNTPDKICWTAHQRAIQRMNSTDKTRILKFIHRCLPTNKKLNDIDCEHTNKCPKCHEIETNEHVTTCKDARQTNIQQIIWRNIAKKLDKQYTHHTVKECILAGIKKTMSGDTTTLQDNDISFIPTGTIQRAIQEQNQFG